MSVVSVWFADLDDELRALVRRCLTDASPAGLDALLERVGPDETAPVLSDAHCSPMSEITADRPALLTAHDAGRLLAGLVRGDLLPEASAAELEEMLREHRHREAVPLGVPEDVEVANLTAGGEGSWHDVAVIRAEGRAPYVLCVLTSGLDEEDAEWRISELARFCWDGLPD